MKINTLNPESQEKVPEKLESIVQSIIDSKVDENECKKGNLRKIYNRLENNFHLSQKKSLFYNIRNYYNLLKMDPYDVIPITFHIQSINDQEYKRFEESFFSKQSNNKNDQNVWIIKPGENSNRGNGIIVTKDIEEIKIRILKNTPKISVIVQKYIEKPLLIFKRKFDIRCYALITSINGFIKGKIR